MKQTLTRHRGALWLASLVLVLASIVLDLQRSQAHVGAEVAEAAHAGSQTAPPAAPPPEVAPKPEVAARVPGEPLHPLPAPVAPREEPSNTGATGTSADPREAAHAARLAAQLRELEAEQDRKRRAWLEGDRRARSSRAARARVTIVLYSTSWCPACKEASAYLREQRIAFTEHDIEKDAAAHAAYQRLTSTRKIPALDVGGQVMVGWDAQRFQQTLDAAARAL